MAKFRLSPELIKVLLPVVIPIAKDLVAKTTTKVDDKIVAALEMALSNPVVLAILLSMFAGDETAPEPVPATAVEDFAACVLKENAEVVSALFALAT